MGLLEIAKGGAKNPKTANKLETKESDSAAGGVSNQKIGAKFENEIVKAAALYRQLGLAWVQRNAIPTIWVPKKPGGGGGFMIHSKKTGFDFIGAFKNSAGHWTPVYIEAKTTKFGEIEVMQESTGIKTHQIRELMWLEEQGMESFILWQIRTADSVYRISPSKLSDMLQEFQRKTLKITDLSEFRVPKVRKVRRGPAEYYDFLNLLD